MSVRTSDSLQDTRPPEPDRQGQRVGNYRLLQLLGQGGMGCVYEAIDETTQGHYAIKVLSARFAKDNVARRRFLQEARAAVAVPNDGLVQVFGTGELPDGTPCLMMKLLTGDLLRQRLQQWPSRQAPLHWVVQMTKQLADAVAAAHEKGIIHCDIKPENVMIVKDTAIDRIGERPILMDFGIAKLCHAPTPLNQKLNRPVGTPTYMSPEQCQQSDALTDRSDVYSLGCVLYELLCGIPPYASDPRDRSHVTRQHIYGRPRPAAEHRPGLPAALYQLLDEMLRRSAAQRPPMSEVAARCDQILNQNPPGMKRAYWPLMPFGILALAACALFLAVFLRPGSLRLRPESVPAGMVLLPATTFLMGSTDAEVAEALRLARGPLSCPDCRVEHYERETPAHPVSVAAFYLDRLETTNAQFAHWLHLQHAVVELGQRPGKDAPSRATTEPLSDSRSITAIRNGTVLVAEIDADNPQFQGLRGLYSDEYGIHVVPGMEDKPVVFVTWDGANQYCQAQGKRLPTEAEWERAARGPERRMFAWGAVLPTPADCALGWPSSRSRGLRPVGSSPRDTTPEGIQDLACNASEWIADRFVSSYAPCQDCGLPPGNAPGETSRRVVRGGSWQKEPDSARGASRSRWDMSPTTGDIGFRCARDFRLSRPVL